jgi:hypothetical protein
VLASLFTALLRVVAPLAEFAKLMDGADGQFAVRSAQDKYSRRQRGYRRLTKLEYMQGWRIEDRDGLPVLRKVRPCPLTSLWSCAPPSPLLACCATLSWSASCRRSLQVWNTEKHYEQDMWGKSHLRGQFKRTWEVISDHGLYTYAMHANPKYQVRLHSALHSAHCSLAAPCLHAPRCPSSTRWSPLVSAGRCPRHQGEQPEEGSEEAQLRAIRRQGTNEAVWWRHGVVVQQLVV